MKSLLLPSILSILLVSSCGVPQIDRKKSDHFDGSKFFNPDFPKMGKSFSTLLKWKFTEKATKWPKEVAIKQQKVQENYNILPNN